MSDANSVTEKVKLIRWRISNEKLRFADELRIIPGWAYGLALVLALGLAVLAPVIRRHDAHPMPPLALTAVIILGSSVLAAVGLLIGYVNRDAKRRGMSPTLWTALVILIPNGIGFIIYFIIREPLIFPCPQCGGKVSARFNFCPKCKFNLHPACPDCKHAVRPEDRYCPYCAHELVAETPLAEARSTL